MTWMKLAFSCTPLILGSCSVGEPVRCDHDAIFDGLHQLVADYSNAGPMDDFYAAYSTEKGAQWLSDLRIGMVKCHVVDAGSSDSEQVTFQGVLPNLEMVRSSIPNNGDEPELLEYKERQVRESMEVIKNFLKEN